MFKKKLSKDDFKKHLDSPCIIKIQQDEHGNVTMEVEGSGVALSYIISLMLHKYPSLSEIFRLALDATKQFKGKSHDECAHDQ